MSLEPTFQTADLTDQVFLDIGIDNPDPQSILGWSFDFVFDPTVLAFNDFDESSQDFINPPLDVSDAQQASGRWRVVVNNHDYDDPTTAPSGTLGTLVFDTLSVGSSDISIVMTSGTGILLSDFTLYPNPTLEGAEVNVSPEPATALLLMGVGVLGLRRRR